MTNAKNTIAQAISNATMIVWDGCDSYILSNLPVYKGSEVFNPMPAIATNIDSTNEDFDWEGFAPVDGVVYQFV